MALYAEKRDISMFRHINKELMRNIISQQATIYKINLSDTQTNIYGESSGGKFYSDPVLLFCLIERGDQSNPSTEFGMDFKWDHTFRFLRDDLVEADILLEAGDIILYQERYYEVDSKDESQYFAGKNPDYPNGVNPLNDRLQDFGYNVSVMVKTHYVPSDKVGISKERM